MGGAKPSQVDPERVARHHMPISRATIPLEEIHRKYSNLTCLSHNRTYTETTMFGRLVKYSLVDG